MCVCVCVYIVIPGPLKIVLRASFGFFSKSDFTLMLNTAWNCRRYAPFKNLIYLFWLEYTCKNIFKKKKTKNSSFAKWTRCARMAIFFFSLIHVYQYISLYTDTTVKLVNVRVHIHTHTHKRRTLSPRSVHDLFQHGRQMTVSSFRWYNYVLYGGVCVCVCLSYEFR